MGVDNMMEKDWLFAGEDYICDIRTVGVLLRGDKVLVQRDAGGTEYALPGGHIKIGETLEEGLVREFKEETGADIRVKRLLWSEECFWEWKGKQAHNIAFYFLIETCGGCDLPEWGEFVSHKDNCDVVIGWLDRSEIPNITIYPAFLKDEIQNLDGTIKHFISK